MKRFLSQTATDERNEKLNGALVCVTDAEVSVQHLSPSKAQRIPIVFLDTSEKERCVAIQPGVIEFPHKPFKKNRLQRSDPALVLCT